MKSAWHIVGCGYVGTRLARHLLAQERKVRATRRSVLGCDEVKKSAPGAELVRFDLADPPSESTAWPSSAPWVVVITSPPSSASPDAEARFAASLPSAVRLLYISTTGVYAPGQGLEVADDHPLAPGSPRGQARLDVEAAIRSAHENSVFLRVPGIYGPGRGVHARLRANTYRLIGAADTLVARIHVDDLVSAIAMLGESSELARDNYIIADDCPTTASEHGEGVAQIMNLPAPPRVDEASVSAEIRSMLSADRRIVAKGLKSLGWCPQYPSWREGLQQALDEEKSELG